MKLILTILLVLAAVDATSCRPKYYSDEERIEMAKSIYVGYVVGIHLVGFEEQKKEEPTNSKVERITFPQPEELTVLIKETHKGRRKTKLNVRVNSCGNGFAELRDKVIVFRNKDYDYITVFDETIYIKILEK